MNQSSPETPFASARDQGLLSSTEAIKGDNPAEIALKRAISAASTIPSGEGGWGRPQDHYRGILWGENEGLRFENECFCGSTL